MANSSRPIYCCLFFFLWCASFIHANESTSNIVFKPTLYELNITTEERHFKNETNVDKIRFNGTVAIHIERPKNSNSTFTLHGHPHTIINSYSLEGINEKGDRIPCDIKLNQTDNGRINIFFNKTDNYEKFILTLNFSNPFGNDMSGFYRSSYFDKDKNETRWLLTTHFEPIFARNAFPCFDQPNLKANYKIVITVPENMIKKGYAVLCNTESKKIASGFTCKTEIPLSSYLVAFTVSDFISTESKSFESTFEGIKKTKLIKTWGQKKIINDKQGLLSLEAAKEAITSLADYLGIGYAYDKIDQVGIPDFSAGAMENWGHISYREKALFFDNASLTTTKQANVLTITHELVHQWFGNLVTLDSWNYIWLNEAFATYLGYMFAEKNGPLKTAEWDYMKQFLVKEIHIRAFETDALSSSKSLSNEITDEKAIYSAFNDIAYSKGAAVLRMWHLALGDELFKNSLRKYLQDRKKQSATPAHLFSAFNEVAKMNESFFKNWHKEPGYPVVEVKKIGNNIYNLSQERFLWEKPSKPEISSVKWTVPITFQTSNGFEFKTEPQGWLENGTLQINASKSHNWIIVNNQQAGYYRVNYDANNWRSLAEALKKENFSGIHEFNRAQIINDVFSLARSVQKDYVDYNIALTLSEYLKNESSFIVWKTALNSFEFLRIKMLSENKYYSKFKEHVLDLLGSKFTNLSSPTNNHIDKLMTIEKSSWACSFDHKPCVEKAQESFRSGKVEPEVEEIVLCTVVRNNDTVWNEIFKKYQAEEKSSQKIMYLTALGCTNNPTIAKMYLNKTLESGSGIRKQDLSYVLSAVYSGNLKNVEVAFTFIKSNYKDIAEKFGGINPLGKALVGIAKKLSSNTHLEDMKKLAAQIKENEKLTGAAESATSALGIIENNIKWNSQRSSQFQSYFKGSGSFTSYSIALLSLCSLLVSQF